MLNPSTIDISLLPFVPLADRNLLPKAMGIYFAIDVNGTVQYIGRSANLLQRCNSHEKLRNVNPSLVAKIAYLEISDASLIKDIEIGLISHFRPPLNKAVYSSFRATGKIGEGNLKNKVKQFLDARGITPYQFERDAKIAHRTAYDLYNNPDQLPSSTVLSKICDAYEIQPGEVLEWFKKQEVSHD